MKMAFQRMLPHFSALKPGSLVLEAGWGWAVLDFSWTMRLSHQHLRFLDTWLDETSFGSASRVTRPWSKGLHQAALNFHSQPSLSSFRLGAEGGLPGWRHDPDVCGAVSGAPGMGAGKCAGCLAGFHEISHSLAVEWLVDICNYSCDSVLTYSPCSMAVLNIEQP